MIHLNINPPSKKTRLTLHHVSNNPTLASFVDMMHNFYSSYLEYSHEVTKLHYRRNTCVQCHNTSNGLMIELYQSKEIPNHSFILRQIFLSAHHSWVLLYIIPPLEISPPKRENFLKSKLIFLTWSISFLYHQGHLILNFKLELQRDVITITKIRSWWTHKPFVDDLTIINMKPPSCKSFNVATPLKKGLTRGQQEGSSNALQCELSIITTFCYSKRLMCICTDKKSEISREQKKKAAE